MEMTEKGKDQKEPVQTVNDEEKLRAYKMAMELATKFGQLASVEGTVPPAIAGISLGAVIGVMSDVSLGRVTRKITNKLRYFSRAKDKIARCGEVINLMRACGWVDEEEYKQMNEDVVSLSKMVWGLIKALRVKNTNKKVQ